MENLDKDKLVTVFTSGNEALISLAKSILDEADITYLVKNEGVQDLIGLGVFGTGYNPVTGPMQIRVLSENEEYAKELLRDLDKSETSSDKSDGDSDK